MATITHGPVQVTISEELALDPRAGNLSISDMRRMIKPPHGVGLVSSLTGDAIEQAGDLFTPPADVTPDALRKLGARAEAYDSVLVALDVVRQTLHQGALLADADAYEALLKVNDMVNAETKHRPELDAVFAALREYMTHPHRGSAPGTS